MFSSMDSPSRPPLPGLTVCAMVVLALGVSGNGYSQEPHVPATPGLRVGPTLEARAVTARSHLRGPVLEVPSVWLRSSAYERDFARAFGFPVGAVSLADSQTFWADLERWLDSRWGESTVFDWVERGLVLYARFQASTRFENRGFDMDLDMDDVAEGKFGVRVSRALDPR